MYFRNDVTVEGFLATKPVLKQSKNGKAYSNFTVCYNEGRKNGEEWINVPHFFRCTAWNNEAENVLKMEKGSAVSVIGKLTYSEYTDKDGKKASSVQVLAFHVRKFDLVKNEKAAEEVKDFVEEETNFEPPEFEFSEETAL